MELIVKQLKNKTPYLAVLFDSESEAARLNQSWVNSYKTSLYKIILEPSGDKITLTLSLDAFSFKYAYKDLKYNQEKLYMFLYANRNVRLYKFAHIVLKNDRHVLVRTSVNQSPFILQIGEIGVLAEY